MWGIVYLLFLLDTTSALWQTVIQNSVSSTSYLTPSGTSVAFPNEGWIKLDGGFKKIYLTEDSSLALTQTGDSSNQGIHVTQGTTKNFYEYYQGSPSLLIYIHGTPLAPLYDIGPRSSFSIYPTNTTTTNITFEKCQIPQPLSTADPPVLNLNSSGFTSLNTLTIAWSWPTPYTRQNPTVQLRDDTGPLVNCTVPVLKRTAPASDCIEQQSVTFDWVTATSQGCFYKSATLGSGDSSQLQYSGVIRLSTQETTNNNGLLFPRPLEYDFRVNLLFSQYAEVSGSITILAPIQIDVTIVGQVHKNTANPPTTYVYIVTGIGYPFKLRSYFVNDWTIIPLGENNNLTTATLVEADLTSLGYTAVDATQAGDTSTQTWQLEVVPGTGACQVDGIYNGTNVLQINCVDPTSFDCDPPVSTGVSLSLSLASENFCGQVVSDIGVSLFLVPTDSTYKVGATSLLIAPGAKAYFKLGLSQTPTGVSIQSISVDRVLISTPGMKSQPLAVLLSGTVMLNFEVVPSSTGLEVHFAFDTSDNSIFNVVPNSKATLTVTARAQIEYTGTSSKRFVQYVEGILPSTDSVVLASVGITALPGASTTLSPPGLMGLFVVIILWLLR